MYERTRFGTTPHSQKVVQDSDAYDERADMAISTRMTHLRHPRVGEPNRYHPLKVARRRAARAFV